MTTICTPRLRLVPVGPSNAETLWRIMQDRELRTYQDLPNMDCAQFITLVSSRRQNIPSGGAGRYEWLIERVDDQRPVGWVSLRVGERTAQSGEIGYSLLEEHRGCGIATEAVRALLDEAFSRGLRHLRAYCVPENERSRVLLRRLGFRENGVLKRGASLRGRAVDVMTYVLERNG